MAVDGAFPDCSLAAHDIAIKSALQLHRGILELLSEVLQSTVVFMGLQGPEKDAFVQLGQPCKTVLTVIHQHVSGLAWVQLVAAEFFSSTCHSLIEEHPLCYNIYSSR